MEKTDRLYDVLGEMLYVVAMADGVIQAEEKEALKLFLRDHTYKGEIEWSFSYEESKHNDINEVYNKVIGFCHSFGPSAVYVEFIDAMKIIAGAVGGIDENEERFIKSFSSDLLARFQRDADKLIIREED